MDLVCISLVYRLISKPLKAKRIDITTHDINDHDYDNRVSPLTLFFIVKKIYFYSSDEYHRAILL